jgi:hypothetical protein
MERGTLLVRVADGAREPFARETLVTLFDGAQRRVHSAVHRFPNVEFSIPVTDGPNDIYRVIVSAKDHLDAGQVGVPLKPGSVTILDLMLIPKRARLVFKSLAELDLVHPKLRRLLEDFLVKEFGAANDAAYQRLQQENPAGLMTFFSIAGAFAECHTPDHPLDFIDVLFALQRDRFFARATDTMVGFLTQRPSVFSKASSLLHPGAFLSYKETRFMEGNVQFSFSPIAGSTLLKVDGDIDLFKDPLSHLLVEVLPNDVLNPPSVTDARRAYAMRWMSVQRQLATGAVAAAFNPPFTLVMT